MEFLKQIFLTSDVKAKYAIRFDKREDFLNFQDQLLESIDKYYRGFVNKSAEKYNARKLLNRLYEVAPDDLSLTFFIIDTANFNTGYSIFTVYSDIVSRKGSMNEQIEKKFKILDYKFLNRREKIKFL